MVLACLCASSPLRKEIFQIKSAFDNESRTQKAFNASYFKEPKLNLYLDRNRKSMNKYLGEELFGVLPRESVLYG